jgi:hypothetical protein
MSSAAVSFFGAWLVGVALSWLFSGYLAAAVMLLFFSFVAFCFVWFVTLLLPLLAAFFSCCACIVFSLPPSLGMSYALIEVF